MARSAAPAGIVDYLVIAINPVLIIALVTSLVFFLADVCYAGRYPDALRSTLFWFVLGAVLIARISMTPGIAERAGLYGAALGFVVWLALQRYVPEAGGLTSLLLIAVVWWSAHRLTWDCTLIDDSVDASGVGLLEEAGIEAESPGAAVPGSSRRKSETTALASWWQRYQRYRDERRRQPHAPGVWVVYFSLAALPLYGVGQSLIPPDDAERRRHAFWLMSVYVASGLGLLLTTSFLGLRRYLRQRKLEMPLAMVGTWMLFGAALIATLLVAGTFLPRPTPEYALVRLPWHKGEQLDASRHAVRGDNGGKGDGKRLAKGKDGKPGDAPAADAEAERGQGEGKKGSGGKGKGDDGGGSKDGKKAGSSKGEDSGASKDGSSRTAPAPPEVAPAVSGLGELLKKIVLVLFGLVVGFLLLRALLRFLANFTTWAGDLLKLWASLWQTLLQLAPRQAASSDAPAEPSRPPPPFVELVDPFASGQAEQMTAEELMRYTFEALEAWARERGLPREADETPLEYAERLAEEHPALESCVQSFGELYARFAYGRLSDLSARHRSDLRELWRAMTRSRQRQHA